MTLGQINGETLAGRPMPEAETASAILAAGDGGYVAVSFPIPAYSDEAAVQRALDGASSAEIEARCGEQGGHWTGLLELEDTDEAPVFADSYGWGVSKHAAPNLGEEDDNVLARVLSLPDQTIDSLKRTAAVGLIGHFE